MSTAYLEYLFPSLARTAYEITSPEDDAYNCIAWAAGETDRWWSPTPGYYWPEEPREETVEAFTRVFEALGFVACPDPEWEQGFEKVAMYAQGMTATHMARQLSPEWWTSKCGGLEDIRHRLDALEGQEYGRVAVILKRSRLDSRLQHAARVQGVDPAEYVRRLAEESLPDEEDAATLALVAAWEAEDAADDRQSCPPAAPSGRSCGRTSRPTRYA